MTVAICPECKKEIEYDGNATLEAVHARHRFICPGETESKNWTYYDKILEWG